MIKVALLGQQFAEQVRTNSEELRELEVAWVGNSVEAFRREVPLLGVGAAVLDIADMPEVAAGDVRALIETSHAELAVVTYSYRTRAFLRELRADHVRMLQAPLTLSTLRAHLAFLMVQDLLGGRGRNPRGPDARPATTGALLAAHPSGCGCGDELDHVITELIAAQSRERSCAGRVGVGEANHQSIESLTQRARATIEEALQLARPAPVARGPQSNAR
jgi:hypothetical protein